MKLLLPTQPYKVVVDTITDYIYHVSSKINIDEISRYLTPTNLKAFFDKADPEDKVIFTATLHHLIHHLQQQGGTGPSYAGVILKSLNTVSTSHAVESPNTSSEYFVNVTYESNKSNPIVFHENDPGYVCAKLTLSLTDHIEKTESTFFHNKDTLKTLNECLLEINQIKDFNDDSIYERSQILSKYRSTLYNADENTRRILTRSIEELNIIYYRNDPIKLVSFVVAPLQEYLDRVNDEWKKDETKISIIDSCIKALNKQSSIADMIEILETSQDALSSADPTNNGDGYKRVCEAISRLQALPRIHAQTKLTAPQTTPEPSSPVAIQAVVTRSPSTSPASSPRSSSSSTSPRPERIPSHAVYSGESLPSGEIFNDSLADQYIPRAELVHPYNDFRNALRCALGLTEVTPEKNVLDAWDTIRALNSADTKYIYPYLGLDAEPSDDTLSACREHLVKIQQLTSPKTTIGESAETVSIIQTPITTEIVASTTHDIESLRDVIHLDNIWTETDKFELNDIVNSMRLCHRNNNNYAKGIEGLSDDINSTKKLIDTEKSELILLRDIEKAVFIKRNPDMSNAISKAISKAENRIKKYEDELTNNNETINSSNGQIESNNTLYNGKLIEFNDKVLVKINTELNQALTKPMAEAKVRHILLAKRKAERIRDCLGENMLLLKNNVGTVIENASQNITLQINSVSSAFSIAHDAILTAGVNYRKGKHVISSYNENFHKMISGYKDIDGLYNAAEIADKSLPIDDILTKLDLVDNAINYLISVEGEQGVRKNKNEKTELQSHHNTQFTNTDTARAFVHAFLNAVNKIPDLNAHPLANRLTSLRDAANAHITEMKRRATKQSFFGKILNASRGNKYLEHESLLKAATKGQRTSVQTGVSNMTPSKVSDNLRLK